MDGKKKDRKKDPIENSENSNEATVKEDEGVDENQGTLVLDATCTPANIPFPTDLDLLNASREQTEKLIDKLNKQDEGKRPRTYRKKARKQYLEI